MHFKNRLQGVEVVLNSIYYRGDMKIVEQRRWINGLSVLLGTLVMKIAQASSYVKNMGSIGQLTLAIVATLILRQALLQVFASDKHS